MRLFHASLQGWAKPADAFIAMYQAEPNAFWFDRETHPSHRFSVIGASAGQINLEGDKPFEALDEQLAALAVDEDIDVEFDWRPGLVGYLDYELAAPRFGFVDRALVFDHDKRETIFVGLFEDEASFTHWHHAALLRLSLIGGQYGQYRHAHQDFAQAGSTRIRHDADAYLARIARAQEHIRRGDVYQICLTNQIEAESSIDPLEAFLRLREASPSPYSTFMRFGDVALVSASPEQFIRVDSARQISSKPIKGTRRRGEDEQQDEALRQELLGDPKERAENLMIVDLMRNDFSAVAEADSVSVPKLFDVETYASVHQLVSTVTARLRADASLGQAVSASFPGGSMTGAPKSRAMQIIAELEAGDRGIYSGAIGHFGCNGTADLAMVIRTAVFEGERITIGVGGGIVLDSDPEAELAETRVKAKALLRALELQDPWLGTW